MAPEIGCPYPRLGFGERERADVALANFTSVIRDRPEIAGRPSPIKVGRLPESNRVEGCLNFGTF